MFRFLLFLTLLVSPLIQAQNSTPSTSPRNLVPNAGELLAPIAIQSGGRPKPFDSFARFNLLSCYQRSSIKLPDNKKLQASDWLAQLLLDPETAYNLPCFYISNEDLASHLSLKFDKSKKNFYSFNELRDILSNQTTAIQKIQQQPEKSRTVIEKQLLELHSAAFNYYSVSRSFSCLTPDITIKNAKLANSLELPQNTPLSFYQIYQHRKKLATIIDEAQQNLDKKSAFHQALFQLANELATRQKHDQQLRTITLIPNEKDPLYGEWSSLWELFDPNRSLSPKEQQELDELSAIVLALCNNDASTAQSHIEAFQQLSPEKVQKLTKVELTYNRLDAFYKSVYFYLLGFLLLCFSWLFFGKQLRWASWSVVLVGLLFHAVGIAMRMYIRNRPAPVTNIYESIIFVGFICVLLGIIIEFKRRDGLGLIIAIIPGSILHFVGFSYALEGDTMGRLRAVLDTNLWLSTHVVTISIGYGASAIAGLIANCYLFVRLFKPSNQKLISGISKNFIGITLLALLFSIIGTILGGIWGDQSWGRFWGWDPKENGALLICLWLLIVVHGKWGKQLNELGVATMLALTNIVVLLAWFGVNLLDVGLHSYGYTEGIALKLAGACIGIFLLTIIPSLLIYFRDLVTPKSNAS